MSIATLPERVMPIVGTAVVIGATIYEIKSDCDLFNDINQLTHIVEANSSEPNEDEICGFTIPSGGVSDALTDFKNEISQIDIKQQLDDWVKSMSSN